MDALGDHKTCYNAAYGGYLEILKWARENNCPWNEYTCTCAASGGHLETLKWARENNCPWNEFTCAYGGYLEKIIVLGISINVLMQPREEI